MATLIPSSKYFKHLLTPLLYPLTQIQCSVAYLILQLNHSSIHYAGFNAMNPLAKMLSLFRKFSSLISAFPALLRQTTQSLNRGLMHIVAELRNSIRHTIQSLTQWSLSTGMNVMPTSYTHRQILTASVSWALKRLLSAIIEEVKIQTANGSGAIVIDVATAIICAPDTDSIPSTNSTS